MIQGQRSVLKSAGGARQCAGERHFQPPAPRPALRRRGLLRRASVSALAHLKPRCMPKLFFFFVSLYSILGRRHASRSVPERRLWWSLLVVDDWIRRSFLPSGLAYACFTGETSSALYLFNSHLEFIYLICFMFYTVYIVLHCFICVTPVCVTLFFFLFCFYLALFFFCFYYTV